MTGQPGERAQRAEALSGIITSRDVSRRAAELAGDIDMRNLLATENVRLVAETSRPDLNSLVLRWMLQRTRRAELLSRAQAALAVALAHAAGDLDRVSEADAALELAGCEEVLRDLEAALSEDGR